MHLARPFMTTLASRKLLVHGGGAAVALRILSTGYRRCLTRGTVDSDVAATGVVRRRSHKPTNWPGTCERCTGAVPAPARTSTHTTATSSYRFIYVCVIKTFPRMERVRRPAEHEHNVGPGRLDKRRLLTDHCMHTTP